jgi:hypothetical protein
VPHTRGEEGKDSQLAYVQGVRPEDLLQGRKVDDRSRKGQLEEDSPEKQPVGEDSDLPATANGMGAATCLPLSACAVIVASLLTRIVSL